MGSNIGSQGCLFPHPYASQGSTFPEVYVTEQSLAVQGAPVRADCSSVPIYLGYETSCKGTEETRDKSTYIPGRHDNFPYRRDHSHASSRYCSNSTTLIGIPHQLGEVSVKEIKELAQKFMDNAYMTARQWSILLGKLAFLATMVPQGRLHQRELQFHLRQHWDFNWDLQTTVQIPMTESVQQTLSWFTHIPNLRVGKPLSQPSPSRTIFTDASLEVWGGHMGSHMASGLWNHEEAQMHINALELKAVINTITEFREMLTDQIVMIATDNTTVLGYLRNQGGTKSYTLFRLTQQLFALLSELRLDIVSRHIPGKKNFLADLLSRPDQLIHTEWTVQSSVLHQLWEDWFDPEIDAFATMLNYQLPLYYSPTPYPQALAVNALNQDWNGLSLYMYPPQSCIRC